LEDSGEPELPLTTHIIQMCSKYPPLSVPDNWSLNVEREKYRQEYHGLMKERGVDFILCPNYVGAGVLPREAKYWSYTAIWNILDQPAITFPSGLKVEKDVDLVDQNFIPRSKLEESEWKACKFSFLGPNIADMSI
jgi:amidase